MSRNTIKYTCIFTLFMLISYAIFPIVPSINSARASGFEKDDIYKGVGIALLLVLISKIGQSRGADSTDSTSGNEDSEIDIGYSDSDVHLLARVIHGESRGEPYEGQVAVGAVVLNRVKSSHFPNTIRDVIYQAKQFSAVGDGQINLTPNSTSYKAAEDAMRGIDPSLGALFFYNPKKARTLDWLSTRKTTIIIGDHVFAL
ncbi:MAG: cell wall hydrolase [Bacillota bacterium]